MFDYHFHAVVPLFLSVVGPMAGRSGLWRLDLPENVVKYIGNGLKVKINSGG